MSNDSRRRRVDRFGVVRSTWLHGARNAVRGSFVKRAERCSWISNQQLTFTRVNKMVWHHSEWQDLSPRKPGFGE
ncbi:hypothetical protein MHYP_G00213770 [Metynnis hypsauchen]